MLIYGVRKCNLFSNGENLKINICAMQVISTPASPFHYSKVKQNEAYLVLGDSHTTELFSDNIHVSSATVSVTTDKSLEDADLHMRVCMCL